MAREPRIVEAKIFDRGFQLSSTGQKLSDTGFLQQRYFPAQGGSDDSSIAELVTMQGSSALLLAIED